MFRFRPKKSPFSLLCAPLLRLPVGLTFFTAHGALAAPSQPIEVSLPALTQNQIAHWKSLILSHRGWAGRERSLIDDNGFFLHPHGRENWQAELRATLLAFREEHAGDQEKGKRPLETGEPSRGPSQQLTEADLSLRCRFPARFHFAVTELKLFPSSALEGKCPAFEDFLSRARGDAVSLVFASSDPSRPGSLFGHTFLRFKDTTDRHAAYLDMIFNFGASAEGASPVEYLFKGLFGGHRGAFAAMPYYAKIQEYVHLETRDLWEYELNLNQAQIDRMLRSLWEWGPFRIDYYYLDDNCAFLMLKVLETADPLLHLSDSFPTWVLPTDSLRRVWNSPGLVKDLSYAPSQFHVFQEAYNELSSQEQRALVTSLRRGEEDAEGAFDHSSFEQLSRSEKVATLNALIHFIDFKAKSSGEEVAPEYLGLRMASLKRRAGFAIKTPPSQPPPPPGKGPHLAPGAQRIRVGARASEGWSSKSGRNLPQLLLGYRAALNGLADAPLGLSPSLAVEVLRTSLLIQRTNTTDLGRISRESLALQELELFHLSSLAPVSRLDWPRSWMVSLGMHRSRSRSGQQLERVRGALSTGYTFSSANFRGGSQVQFSLFAKAHAGAAAPVGQRSTARGFAALSAVPLLRVDLFHSRSRFSLWGRVPLLQGAPEKFWLPRWQTTASLSLRLTPDTEIFLAQSTEPGPGDRLHFGWSAGTSLSF